MSVSFKSRLQSAFLVAAFASVNSFAIAQETTPGSDSVPATKVVPAEQGDAPEQAAAEAPALTVGSQAPAIDVEHWVSTGNGKFQPIKQFDAGKVYVVEFWATWCGPCIASMPHLVETQNAYADKGVQIISISDEDLETVKAFLERPVQQSRREQPEAEETEAEKPAAEEKEQTYGQLTSAYCLTTDPDRSVSRDYMEAAGQNGIPTSFIVGKSGLIEWIGHPMSMDEPLQQVVADKWDRELFLAEFKKQQERDLLLSSISNKLRSGDVEGAKALIAEAKSKAEGDAGALQMLEQLELNVVLAPALTMLRSGDVEGGLQALNQLSAGLSAKQQAQVSMFKLQLMLQSKNFAGAAEALKQIADSKEANPEMLNAIAWNLYDMNKKSGELGEELISAATYAAEKAAQALPENGPILDTLAHLLEAQGQLDRAIEVQTEAVKNPQTAEAEIKAYLDELKAKKAAQ